MLSSSVRGMLALLTTEGAPLPGDISPVLTPPMELSTHEHSMGKPKEVGNVQPLHTCVNDAAFNYVTTYYFFPQGMASLGTQDGPQAPGREVRLCGDGGCCRQGPPSSAAEAGRCVVNEAGLWEGKGQSQALAFRSAGWGSGPTTAPGTLGDAGEMETLMLLLWVLPVGALGIAWVLGHLRTQECSG